LFIPFLELKNRIGLIKEEHHNIGLGLACSKDLTKKLGGDIKVIMSQPGLTNIAFKIGVKVKHDNSFSNWN
jgi:C4-dicarboxylate-specific signal transduction histidine kinase